MTLKNFHLKTPLKALLVCAVLGASFACNRNDREDAADQIEEGAEEVEDEIDDAL